MHKNQNLTTTILCFLCRLSMAQLSQPRQRVVAGTEMPTVSLPGIALYKRNKYDEPDGARNSNLLVGLRVGSQTFFFVLQRFQKFLCWTGGSTLLHMTRCTTIQSLMPQCALAIAIINLHIAIASHICHAVNISQPGNPK